MLKLLILNFHGKIKVVNSCKLVHYKHGKQNKDHPNLLKNGQKDTQNKYYVLIMMKNQKELLLVYKMVLLMLLL